MALVLEANYSKKLGLPGYSSHQYSVTVRTELRDLSQIEAESARLYRLLQTSVDREIQQTGFLPAAPSANGNANGYANGHGNGSAAANGSGGDAWRCSAKQKELILSMVEEHRLAKSQVEELAQKLFGSGVKSLNKLQTSGLITELISQFPSTDRNGKGRATRPAGRV